jgi:hypothetical protein
VRLGIAEHLGWAIAVAASADHAVVDRRRIELGPPWTRDHRVALAATIVAGLT